MSGERTESRVRLPGDELALAAEDAFEGKPFEHHGEPYLWRRCPWAHGWEVDHCAACAPLWGVRIFRIVRKP